jgi:hypothetical protein
MDKSKLPQIAKALIKKIEKSDTRDIVLYVRKNEFIIEEYEAETPEGFDTWDSTLICFNYIDEQTPTEEEIVTRLKRIF